MPDQSVSTSQAEAVTQPTEISSSVTSSAPQPSYKVGDKVRNTVGKWEGKVVEFDVNKIKVFGTSCSAWYNLNSSSFELILKPVSAYVPAVGDVVEFEYLGKVENGVVFHDGDELSLANSQKDDYTYVNTAEFMHSSYGLSKIGYIDKVIGIKSRYAIAKIAKAHFSAPTLTGTYEEKQAQWIEHHGIKMDITKVRITRKPEDGEGEWKRPWKLDDYIGKVLTVYSTCDNDTMSVHTKSDFLYAPFFVLEPVK